jgi:predicted kinase
MKQLLILVGISGSGKSTLATKICRTNPDWIRVCRDSLREHLFCYTEKDVHKYYKTTGVRQREEMVSQAVTSLIECAWVNKKNVIVDATNLKINYIKEFVEKGASDFDIEIKVLDVDVKECMRRDFQRDRAVGPAVINKQYKQLKTLLNNQEFKTLLDEYRGK